MAIMLGSYEVTVGAFNNDGVTVGMHYLAFKKDVIYILSGVIIYLVIGGFFNFYLEEIVASREPIMMNESNKDFYLRGATFQI